MKFEKGKGQFIEDTAIDRCFLYMCLFLFVFIFFFFYDEQWQLNVINDLYGTQKGQHSFNHLLVVLQEVVDREVYMLLLCQVL